MAQRKNRRSKAGRISHPSCGAVAGLSTLSPLPASRAVSSALATDGSTNDPDGATIWSRRRVLLLNSSYEPLTALSMRRAIVMVICGKADIVHEDPTAPLIRSASTAVVVPSVIRLRNFVLVPHRARIPLTRSALMRRDRFSCAYCGGKADTVDHVVPRSRGGAHVWENCVACCAKCNHRKADRLLAELGWTLRMVPMAPKGRYWRLLNAIKELDPSWVRYLGEGAA